MPAPKIRLVRVRLDRTLDDLHNPEDAHDALDQWVSLGYQWRATQYLGAREEDGETVEHALVTLVYDEPEAAPEHWLLRWLRRWLG